MAATFPCYMYTMSSMSVNFWKVKPKRLTYRVWHIDMSCVSTHYGTLICHMSVSKCCLIFLPLVAQA